MRRFHSYGPVDPEEHFCVPRRALIEQCVEQLLGAPDKGGHYFTIWAPRQTGKTWLMRRAAAELRARHGDRFLVGTMSMQGVVLKEGNADEAFLRYAPSLVRRTFKRTIPQPPDWQGWLELFSSAGNVFDRPLLLFIDEFDKLPRAVIDRLIELFRDMYLDRENFLLHGLALVGVRAVLGVDSDRGSPFNVQRSLHVPNLNHDEVADMYRQYQQESGQVIDPAVVERVHEVTRGQPGLVSWFGELLTEKYNLGRDRTIALREWSATYGAASRVEPNNTVLNLLKKAQGSYRRQVVELFARADVPFSIDAPWCSYLYLNGIIDYEDSIAPSGETLQVCRFSSPFIQHRLYNALSSDLVRGTGVPTLDPLDELTDVFAPAGLNVPALLARYRDYLGRLRQRGIDPWQGQPRREDLHLTEAVGHFHLYAWLWDVVGRECIISPEFPTGNGKVDLILTYEGRPALIEVKSLEKRSRLGAYRRQTAAYAQNKGLAAAALALFVPTQDEAVLRELSGEEDVGGVRVTTVAIG